MTESATSNVKITKWHFFLYLNIYLLPVLVSWVTFVQLRLFDFRDTIIGFTSPVAIIGMSLVYGFVLFLVV